MSTRRQSWARKCRDWLRSPWYQDTASEAVCWQSSQISPVKSPQAVPDINSPGDVPSDLQPRPSLRVHGQRVGGEVSLAGPRVEAEHHHVLTDHVEGYDDCLTHQTGTASSCQGLHSSIVDPVHVQQVSHSFIGGHVTNPRHHLEARYPESSVKASKPFCPRNLFVGIKSPFVLCIVILDLRERKWGEQNGLSYESTCSLVLIKVRG